MSTHKGLTALLALGLLTLSAQSCYREAPITAELGTPEYVIEDGSDYVTGTIYDIYEESGVKLIYSFDPTNTVWNIGRFGITSAVYTPLEGQEDLPMIEKNLRYLDKYFIRLYSDDFRSKNFPVYIFLCDTIRSIYGQTMTAISLDHLALNLYRDGEVFKDGSDSLKLEEEYFRVFAPRVHAALWEFIFTYRFSQPEQFAGFNEYPYEENFFQYRKDTIIDDDGNEQVVYRSDLFEVKEFGFWSIDKDWPAVAWAHSQSMEKDLADFVNRLVMYSEEENLAEVEGYTILSNKFEALRREIIEMSGMDLQEIGNAYAPYRRELEALIPPKTEEDE